jgi:hypothetical protein
MRDPQFDSCPENQLLTEVFQDINSICIYKCQKNTSEQTTSLINVHVNPVTSNLMTHTSMLFSAGMLTDNKAKLNISKTFTFQGDFCHGGTKSK